ncbi:hypothetical protein Q5P01_024891 [Channa striata]|uniref:Calmodulin-regulated spectrin-associated protein 1-B-like n=1 Tax=Channa striata TaxID=64152 RepID=A0AA88J8I6_CHASR|nr:hypothetical protein Q5P01_024891 [Channa striata]
MDVEVSAGRNTTWRRGAAAADDGGGGGGGGSMEVQVVPLELYDSARAKIDANLRWLFAKAYGEDNIPADMRDPFYTDQYEQEHIKPPIIRLLLSGELYYRVCGLILHAEQAASLQSHQSVIQALSRKGIYVLETDNTYVSDLDLSSSPIKMSSHIHLIDSLMMAYTAEMISIEKVVTSVKRFLNFSASKELPFDLEDAIVFWINKVNTKMREITDKELKINQHLLESPSHQKSPSKWYWKLVPVRYRRDHLSGRTHQHFPVLDDLLKDVSDGMALLSVIHFYCPELIRLEDICLKEVPSIADSVYNIQLLKEFAEEYLNKCFYLKPEDMLYSPPVLKINVMVFIAELFWWFESVKPDFVQPRDLQEIRDVRLLLQPKSSRSHVPISSVTKRSFLTTSTSADVLTTPPSPDLSTKPRSLSPSQSLLPLRQKQQKVEESAPELRKRSCSLLRADEKQLGLVMAWPERRQRPLSQPMPYALHHPLEDNADSISLARSISKDSLASNIISSTPKHMLRSGSHMPQHRLSGQSLLSHMRIEDEEEEIEEEELVAVIHPSAFIRHRPGSDMEQDELEMQIPTSISRVSSTCSPCLDTFTVTPDHQADSYYLEPLIPAIPKPAKEKGISENKQEESGESRSRATVAAGKGTTNAQSTSQRKPFVTESNNSPPIPVAESVASSLRPPTERSVDLSPSRNEQGQGFFLHLSEEPDGHSPFSTTLEVGHDSDSDIADLEEDDDEDDQMELLREVEKRGQGKCLEEGEAYKCGEGEDESAKLREDLKLSERDDKEDRSVCSSPCLSTASWASSCSASGSANVRMTSFAERKLLKLGLRDGFSSTSSSQKTTPDGSDVIPCPPWQLRSDSSSGWLGKEPGTGLGKTMMGNPPVVPSELLQLHMQLEEQRRAIEYQKKKMETLSARQRLKLGKAAFLNIVKKGGGRSGTLPLPLKHSRDSSELTGADKTKAKSQSCRDDSCLDALKVQAKAGQQQEGQINRDNRLNTLSQDNVAEPDLNDCSRSIDLLNEAISSIQQQMIQLCLQQDLLMKQSVVSPPDSIQSTLGTTPNTTQAPSSTSDSKSYAVHFVDISDSNPVRARRPPKLSSSQRCKASDRKQNKENIKMASLRSKTQSPEHMSSPRESTGGDQENEVIAESSRLERNIQRNTTFRIHDGVGEVTGRFSDKPQSQDPPVISNTPSSSQYGEQEENKADNSEKEALAGEESTRVKGNLIEVDLSELKEPLEDGSADVTDCNADGEQKNVLGFFFKDDEKAEDEMAKRRAAFLLKQQRKAEEAKLRKQQQEAETELKRDEARRKAEEDRVRKEEEKARRELIKQEYLRRKQQALMEEQGLVKPRPRNKSQRNRHKSLHREEFNSLSKGSTTRNSLKVLVKAQGSAGCREADLSCSRGSTLSLATETDSVVSGGADSQRAGSVCSMESFPMLSRASSRNMERDWENGSIASSVTSAEYNGPKLFKEPSSKSNKPIIINAIAHCCLAGKVNEAQKNIILEELEKCESNHLIILFRDGGCQFRAIYSYSPDTEEIVKFTGTGPRHISRKMIDKLYKYSSDRKQFNIIPAKTVSVSVDALTIHNHLWQVKRPGSAQRK